MTDDAPHPRACVLAREERGEADLRVHLLLDDDRCVWVTARSAQKSVRRFAGGLSAFVVYRVMFEPSRGGTTLRLAEAVVDRGFPGVLSSLIGMVGAGACSMLVRELAGDLATGGVLFEAYVRMLETLDASPPQAMDAIGRFAWFALEHSGHGAVLDRCVRCARVVPDGARVQLDPDAGGVVCAACGGGPITLRANARTVWLAWTRGEPAEGAPEAALVALARMIEPYAPRATRQLFDTAASPAPTPSAQS